MKRYEVIDVLRGLAIVITILTHTLSYFLQEKNIYTLWDRIHFVVPIFVFVSAFLSYKKNDSLTSNPFKSLFKRLTRLLIPYYVFLVPYFILVAIAESKKLTTDFIISNFLVTGGVDINWLVLLFIYLAILVPVMVSLIQKKPAAFYTIFCVSTLSSALLLNYQPAIHYKLYMWLPWLSVVCVALIISQKPTIKRILLLLGATIFIFILTQTFQFTNGHSLMLFANKYPPNLYYLSHGIVWTLALYIIFMRNIPFKSFNRFISFSSKNSYTLYFIHYLVIYTLVHFTLYKNLNVWIFTGIVFVITYFLQYMSTKLLSSFKNS